MHGWQVKLIYTSGTLFAYAKEITSQSQAIGLIIADMEQHIIYGTKFYWALKLCLRVCMIKPHKNTYYT